MANKKCESLKVAKKTSNEKVLALAKQEWIRRFVNEDGTAKKNRWAPIYILRGDEQMVARLAGENLILQGTVATCPKPAPKHTEWS